MKRIITYTISVGVAILTGCAQPGLIPRQVLFGNPEKAGPQISPDGEKISFLAPVNGVLNVWVAPAADLTAARPVTEDTGQGIRMHTWAYTSEHILYFQDKDGDENWRVYTVNLKTDERKALTPEKGVRAQIQELSPRFPEEILVGLNDRDARYHDVHKINIVTGERTSVKENPGFTAFVTDDSFAVRFAMRYTEGGGMELLQAQGEGWESFAKLETDDALTTRPVGFNKGGDVLYMIDSRGRDTVAFTAVNLSTGEKKTVAGDSRADVINALIHPTEKTVQAVAVNYLRRTWIVLDPSVGQDLKRLEEIVPGSEVQVVSRSLDDGRWIIRLSADNRPSRYYYYDRATKEADFLFTNRPNLEGLELAHMYPVVIPSRDGLNLVSYLTLPQATASDQAMRPVKPLPMVLIVHGGPWARDVWGFHPYHQWLANRGYAVLSVNFRGSTGFGKAFLNAGTLQWGAAMHEDLIDAVNWAVKQGIADEERVAIFGGSYGGYAALVGLTFTPDVFACGVDIVGPSNLITLLESIPAYWAPQLQMFRTRVGDLTTDDGRALLRSRSPLNHAEKIKRPLLIAQGANDPRVKQAESDQIVAAMQKRDIPVTYVLYPDEGHGFRRPENTLSFSAVAEAFLARHLGGAFEPVGDDFEGSSIEVPVGADQIPRLAAVIGTAGSD